MGMFLLLGKVSIFGYYVCFMIEQEVLFYGEVSNFTVSSYIGRLQEAKRQHAHINILANSFGGDPDAGFGLIAQTRSYPYRKMMTIHGSAYSMMAFAALFVDEVRAIQQTKVLFHRAAAFNMEEEQIPVMRDLIVSRNEDLRKAMEEKLNIAAFERISGVTLDEMFSMDTRIDVVLNAEQAREIGMVKEIIPISAIETEEINSKIMAASGGHGIQLIDVKKQNSMKTLEELKEKHPELYAQAIQAGKKEATPAPASPNPKEDISENDKLIQAGIDKERERVKGWQTFAEVDAKKVAEGIASGNSITMADIGEFTLTAQKNSFAGALKKGTDTSGRSADNEGKNKDTELSDELSALGDKVTANFKSKFGK